MTTLTIDFKGCDLTATPDNEGKYDLNEIRSQVVAFIEDGSVDCTRSTQSITAWTRTLSEGAHRFYSLESIRNSGTTRGKTLANEQGVVEYCRWLSNYLGKPTKKSSYLYVMGVDLENLSTSQNDMNIGTRYLEFLIKIGITSNLDSRLSAVQTGCPFPLKFLCTVETDNASEYEQFLHEALSGDKETGEWFNPCLFKEEEGLINVMELDEIINLISKQDKASLIEAVRLAKM